MWWRGQWREATLVDTLLGFGWPVAERNRLHFLWRKQTSWDVWYSWRPLGPPAIAEPERGLSFLAQTPNPMGDRSNLRLFLDQRVEVKVEMFDLSGRMVLRKGLGWLGPGDFVFQPGRLLSNKGVYYLVIWLGSERKVTKIVRID